MTDYLLVAMQFALLGGILLMDGLLITTPDPVLKWAGALILFTGILTGIVAVIQMNRYLTVFPTPKKGARLLSTGVYSWIRHPMYTALILAGSGYALWSGSLLRLVLTIILLILFEYKSQYEEVRLSKFFDEYESYQKTTGKFIPRLQKWKEIL